MIVEIDTNSGFCFGVQNAVKIAETALSKGEKVFSLGAIVHNDKEVERLKAMGLITIEKDELDELHDCNLLIRAHGEPPEIYRKAEEKNIKIIEATCPIVKKLQSRIRAIWEKARTNNGQIVIFGKTGHAEVIGLIGQTDNKGILVTGVEDIDKIDFKMPIYLFSQTTMSINRYKEVTQAIEAKIKADNPNFNKEQFRVFSTICGQVSSREPLLREFAAKHNIIIFVSGKDSSNGRILYSICSGINPLTYFISSVDEIDKNWFIGKNSTGICGATSTPKWLIEETKKKIESFNI